jgi:beta-glucosidase
VSRASGRAQLAAAAAHELDFTVPLDRLAYTLPDGRHGLEAGLVTLLLGLSSADIRDEVTIEVPP